MPIDKQMYDRLSHTWWEGGFLSILKSGLNPARFGYMRRILVNELGLDPAGLRTLDVGCGGGLLAEEFAQLGCAVTGVDPSPKSIEVAREHAAIAGFDIDYREASGESLPFADGEFPVVYCCDVLEHVDDVGRTVNEIARVLEPGGVFLFDTINRTRRSRLLMIKVAQDWKGTAFADPDLHDFDMFIKPVELDAHLKRAGLRETRPGRLRGDQRAARAEGHVGPCPRQAQLRRTRQKLTMKESKDHSVTYGGYALKPSTLI